MVRDQFAGCRSHCSRFLADVAVVGVMAVVAVVGVMAIVAVVTVVEVSCSCASLTLA